MTFFSHAAAAQRYARSRPYFHPLVIDKIRRRLGLTGAVARALDVACGTGQSATALAEIAGYVVGTDISVEMLGASPRSERIGYLAAQATVLPFPGGAFDLATVALAFHWFDREKFLAEARRVLKENGWLVIYNNWFTGKMSNHPAFERWFRDLYLVRYPTPPRQGGPITPGAAEDAGFRWVAREDYTNQVEYSPGDLAAYLTTQSNLIAAVEQGSETIEEVHRWLGDSLAPLFSEERATFEFAGVIEYLQKQ